MSDSREILAKNAAIFILIWYTFTCITSGTVVPAGIFLPCILIGCSLGSLYAPLHNKMFHASSNDPDISSSFFYVIVSTTVLCGATRMTFAFAVIML